MKDYKSGKNMKLFTAGLAIFLAATFIVILVAGPALSMGHDSVTRLFGANRWETSANVALAAYPGGSENVIIARGDDAGGWADGLAGGYLAGVLDAPILLTAPGSLPASVESAILTLGAQKAYILGGTGAVSAGVEAQLSDLGLETERIYGANREATAAQIAGMGEVADNTAFVVQGRAPADSMVAGAAAFAKSYPILLVNKDSVPGVTSSAITNLVIENIIIVGGSGVVSTGVATELADIPGVNSVTRLSGVNREATSVAFAEGQFSGWVDFSIVNGRRGLADAVGASVFGNPILYVNSIPEIVKDYLDDEVTNSSILRIFGGTAVVSANVGNLLWDIIDEAPPGPNFTVFPFSDIWGERWKANTEITIEIYDGDETEVYYRNSDSTGHFQLQFDETFDVQAGHIVTVFDGVTNRSHTVKHLLITDINLDTNEVFGEAEPGRNVEVGIRHIYPPVYVEADNQGHWSADLSAIHQIAPGDMVYVSDRDELGNDTGFEWRVPDPRFEVYPHDDYIIGHGWPGGEELTITIEGDDYTVQTRDDGFFFRRLYTEVDIQRGDVITIADFDGQVVETYVVKYLVIEEVDYDNDKVTGSADFGSKVNVVVRCKETWDWLSFREDIAEDGQWEADFSADVGDEWWAKAIDLNPDEHTIFAYIGEIIDEGDNATFHDWYDDQGVWVNPAQNIVDGWYWAPEAEIKVTIAGVEHTAHSDVYGNFTLKGVALDAGDDVTVNDGTMLREYKVLELEITDIDYEANTMSGTAPPNMVVRVNKFEYPDFIFTESDADGNWTADFADSIYGMEGMKDIGPDCFGDVVLRDGYSATYLMWPDE